MGALFGGMVAGAALVPTWQGAAVGAALGALVGLLRCCRRAT